jgi:hypothetical protein
MSKPRRREGREEKKDKEEENTDGKKTQINTD